MKTFTEIISLQIWLLTAVASSLLIAEIVIMYSIRAILSMTKEDILHYISSNIKIWIIKSSILLPLKYYYEWSGEFVLFLWFVTGSIATVALWPTFDLYKKADSLLDVGIVKKIKRLLSKG